MHALGPQWMDPQYLLDTYGSAFFWLSIAIVFVECGLFFPILPGDSLLFAVGIFVASGQLDVPLAAALAALLVAAFGGNVVGYEIGRAVGAPLRNRDGRIVKRKYFDQTEAFFERHGAKALVLGRFVPIVRTYVTVVAGIGRMERRHFYTWSGVGAVLWVVVVTLAGYFLEVVADERDVAEEVPGVGAVLWVVVVTLAGYFLGNVPLVRDNLEAAILLIVALSVVPMVVEYLRHRRDATMSPAEVARESDEVVDEVEHRG